MVPIVLRMAKIMGIFLFGFHCLHSQAYCTNSSGFQTVGSTPFLPGALEQHRGLSHMPVSSLLSGPEPALGRRCSPCREGGASIHGEHFSFSLTLLTTHIYQSLSTVQAERVISCCFGMLINAYNIYQLPLCKYSLIVCYQTTK